MKFAKPPNLRLPIIVQYGRAFLPKSVDWVIIYCRRCTVRALKAIPSNAIRIQGPLLQRFVNASIAIELTCTARHRHLHRK